MAPQKKEFDWDKWEYAHRSFGLTAIVNKAQKQVSDAPINWILDYVAFLDYDLSF